MTAAIDEPKHVVMRDFLAETDAARAENAALVIKGHARTKLEIFVLFHLVLKEAGLLIDVVDAELLQKAFAGLVADRTVERVIDQEKFHHPVPTVLNQRRVRANGHAVSDVLRAANLWTWHPVDDGYAVGAEFRLAIRA